MARNYYNKYGVKTGYSTSSREENSGTGWLIIAAVVLAPFYPLFVGATYAYGFLTDALHLHSLFAGIASVALFFVGLYLLWKSVTFRQLYLGCSTVFAGYWVFMSTYPGSDIVWAAFFAVLTLVVGFALTYASGLVGTPSAADSDEPTKLDPYFGSSGAVEPSLGSIDDNAGLSYSLSIDEAVELLDRIDDTAFEVLQAVLEQSPEPNLAGLSWTSVQDIAGAHSWTQFVRGTMAKLHRELRSITGDPAAVLLLDSDKVNLLDEPAPDQGKVLLIHGPVVQTLKSLL